MLSWEIKKLTKTSWLPFLLLLVLGLWCMMMYLASPSGEQRLIERFYSFWHELGSLTMGFIVLFVNARLFSMDAEQHTKEVISSTALGKRQVLLKRFLASAIYTGSIFAILAIIQLAGAALFIENPITVFTVPYVLHVMVVFLGSELFTLFAACLCMMLISHTSTVIICTFLFGVTYIVKGEAYEIFSFTGVLEKGFFSYLIRAQYIFDIQWGAFISWYTLLIGTTTFLMIYLQSRRHEL